MVKEARMARLEAQDGLTSPKGSRGGKKFKLPPDDPSNNIPTDVYYMITINCRYKRRIHDLLK